MEKDQRIDLRELIFREIVANVIVHREYTNASPSSLVIYDDRVEVSNPNTVRFRGYLDPTNFQPYPKNPLISKLFIELGWAEEIGSGIINVNKYLPHYADGESPTFIEEDQFRTILPLKRNTFEHRAPWVWEFLGFTPSQESKMALTQLSLPQALTLSSSQSEFLFSLAAKWLLEGGKLPDLRMLTVKQAPTLKDWNHTSYPTKGTKLPPSKSAHTGSKRNVAQAKDTSWGAKGTKLYGKRMIILMTVLGELLSPTSMEDLIAQLGYSNRRSFMDTYIKPLMKYQLIERTIPDTPRHPDQKYRSSAKGRRFLGGFEL